MPLLKGLLAAAINKAEGNIEQRRHNKFNRQFSGKKFDPVSLQ